MIPDIIHLDGTHDLVIDSYNFRSNETLSFREHGIETGTDKRFLKLENLLRARAGTWPQSEQ